MAAPLSRDPVSGRVLPRGVTVSARGRIQWTNPPGVDLTLQQRAALTRAFRGRGTADTGYLQYLTARTSDAFQKPRRIVDWARDRLRGPEPGVPPPPEPSEGTEEGMRRVIAAAAQDAEVISLYGLKRILH